jgi:hypothetical protein
VFDRELAARIRAKNDNSSERKYTNVQDLDEMGSFVSAAFLLPPGDSLLNVGFDINRTQRSNYELRFLNVSKPVGPNP